MYTHKPNMCTHMHTSVHHSKDLLPSLDLDFRAKWLLHRISHIPVPLPGESLSTGYLEKRLLFMQLSFVFTTINQMYWFSISR